MDTPKTVFRFSAACGLRDVRSTTRVVRLSVLVLVIVATASVGCFRTQFPGQSYDGALPTLTVEQVRLRDRLQADVTKLAGEIGERHVFGREKELAAAGDYIEAELTSAGYAVRQVDVPFDGSVPEGEGETVHVVGTAPNIEVEIRGSDRAGEIVVVGAHFDTVKGTPGADDNASGVAALLALARIAAGTHPSRTLRFVGFFNEEPPFFNTGKWMGSEVYAQECAKLHENVVAMLSLEAMGYFADGEGTQDFPGPLGWFYPSRGNFIAFVGNGPSDALVESAIVAFRRQGKVPSEGLVSNLGATGFSDQRSFWRAGYRGLMVTDTALFRNETYHEATDVPDTLDYVRLALVVEGLREVLADLAGIGRPPIGL